MRLTFGFADDPFDKPPCRGCSSYLTEPYVKCAECGPPPFLLCLQVSARRKAKALISVRMSSKACWVPSCSMNTLITGLYKLVSTHLFAQGQGNDKEKVGGWRAEARAAERDLCEGSQSYLKTCSQPDCVTEHAAACLERYPFCPFLWHGKKKPARNTLSLSPHVGFLLPNGTENLGKVCNIGNNCDQM